MQYCACETCSGKLRVVFRRLGGSQLDSCFKYSDNIQKIKYSEIYKARVELRASLFRVS